MAILRVGLPMWSLPEWQHRFFSDDAGSADYLKQYASVFNTVEGNTTFYAIPSEASIMAWAAAVPRDFRFSFKLPKVITHDLKLQRCDETVAAFFDRIAPLRSLMGPIQIQLPPSFDGQALPILAQFVRKLPAMFNYAVEVRHSDFFNGSEYHTALTQLLQRCRMERVVFDSRGLFDAVDGSVATLEAQAKKPNFPVIEAPVIKQPIIRFIGHPDMAQNPQYFEPWIARIKAWLEAGKEPYVMLHMADNTFAPDLALQCYKSLQQEIADLADLADWPSLRESPNGQMGLF